RKKLDRFLLFFHRLNEPANAERWHCSCSVRAIVPQAEDRQWYVVYSKPHGEDYARFHIRLKGIETFLPRLLLPISRRKHKRIVPLFPNYLFAYLDAFSHDYYEVIWAPGVRRI